MKHRSSISTLLVLITGLVLPACANAVSGVGTSDSGGSGAPSDGGGGQGGADATALHDSGDPVDASGDGNGDAHALACVNPAPLVNVTGGPEVHRQATSTVRSFTRCADGSVHRIVEDVACNEAVYTAAPASPGCPFWGPECYEVGPRIDDGGTGLDGGGNDGGEAGAGGLWGAACVTDSDCGAGQVCKCGVALADGSTFHGVGLTWTYCIEADCNTDADCGEYECGLYLGDCGDRMSLHCRTANDECRGREDCRALYGADNRECGFSRESNRWECFELGDCE